MSTSNHTGWLALLLCFVLVPSVAAAQALQTSSIPRASRAGEPDYAKQTRDLSDKSQDAWNALYNKHDDVAPELHMNVGSFAGLALALSQLAADNRGESVIKSGATKLVSLALEIDTQANQVRSPGFREAWASIQQQLSDLGATWNLGYRPPARTGGGRRASRAAAGASSGWLRWEGRVDGSDYIVLQGDSVSIRHLQNNPITGATHELSGPLPRTATAVRLNKLRGRGRVEIIGQPTPLNGFTCTVLVEDPEGGADLYRFEIVW